ncbi:unnamed protein product, partial [Rotaria sp. Silwood1]
MKSISSETKDIINIPVESISMKQINEQIVEHQPSLAEQKLEHFPSIGNLETDKQKFSEIDFEFMYNLIDQSYTKIPIIYNSIKQTKLDTDFVLSVNNYL